MDIKAKQAYFCGNTDIKYIWISKKLEDTNVWQAEYIKHDGSVEIRELLHDGTHAWRPDLSIIGRYDTDDILPIHKNGGTLAMNDRTSSKPVQEDKLVVGLVKLYIPSISSFMSCIPSLSLSQVEILIVNSAFRVAQLIRNGEPTKEE